MLGWCVKCQAKREFVDPIEVLMKNKRRAIKGTCPVCGKGMFIIIKWTDKPLPEAESKPEVMPETSTPASEPEAITEELSQPADNPEDSITVDPSPFF